MTYERYAYTHTHVFDGFIQTAIKLQSWEQGDLFICLGKRGLHGEKTSHTIYYRYLFYFQKPILTFQLLPLFLSSISAFPHIINFQAESVHIFNKQFDYFQ